MRYPDFLSPFVISPDIPIRWYGVMYIVGIVSAYFILRWSERRGGLKLTKHRDKKGNMTDDGGIFDLIFYGALGTVIGARLGYFIFYSPSTFLRPWEILGFIFTEQGVNFEGFSGMSFHGGMLGIALAVFIFSRKYKYSMYMLCDNITLAMSAALFFGRIGNFLNAELYGRPTKSIFGIEFPIYDLVGGYEAWLEMIPAIRPYTEPRHPSQLYEAFLEGLLLAVIMILLAKNKKLRAGTRLWVWIALYGLFRTLVESVRAVSEWQIGFFTAGMVYSIPMIIVGVAMLVVIYTRKEKEAK